MAPMADAFMTGCVLVGIANVALASLLLVVYGGIFAKTKARFSLALVAFATAFLLHNALLVYSYATMMDLMPAALTPYLFGVGLFEAGGLGAVLWTATR